MGMLWTTGSIELDGAFVGGIVFLIVVFLVGRFVIRRTRREINRARANWTDDQG
jgi:hypothetical protein